MAIYVWLKHIQVMHIYKSLEEFTESTDYQFQVIDGENSAEIMREFDTPLWKR